MASRSVLSALRASSWWQGAFAAGAGVVMKLGRAGARGGPELEAMVVDGLQGAEAASWVADIFLFFLEPSWLAILWHGA